MRGDGSIRRLVTADHDLPHALLSAAVYPSGGVHLASNMRFRGMLLRHHGIDRTLLSPASRRANGEDPPPMVTWPADARASGRGARKSDSVRRPDRILIPRET